jgi:hypothetical protein
VFNPLCNSVTSHFEEKPIGHCWLHFPTLYCTLQTVVPCVWVVYFSYLEPDNPSAGSASLLPVRHTKYALPRQPPGHGHNRPGRGQEGQSLGVADLSGLRDKRRSRSAQGAQSFARRGLRALSSSRASFSKRTSQICARGSWSSRT